MHRALDNLESFIIAVRSLQPVLYATEINVDIYDHQQSLGPASDEVERTFTFELGGNEHCYRYAGPHVLNDEGKLNEEARERYKRVIFTPSKGRCDIGLLRWSTELADTLGGVVVPCNELTEYSQKWGASRLVIGVDHDCVNTIKEQSTIMTVLVQCITT